MLAKSYIEKNLRSLDAKFRKTTSRKDSLFYSKLAILELCGWLEESIDIIILDFAKKKIIDKKNQKLIKEKIRRNYGFDYENNFRHLLINVVGVIGFEKLESSIDSVKLALFISTLTTLVAKRNSEAHTHIKGTAKTIDAPSVSIVHFNNLYNGLHEFEIKLKSLKI